MFPAINAVALHNLAARDLGWQVGPLRFSVIEAVVLIVALAMALASAAGLWRIGMREDRQTRLEIVRRTVNESEKAAASEGSSWRLWLSTLLRASPIVRFLSSVRLRGALTAAGFRSEHHLVILVIGKICGALVLAGLWWWLEGFATAPFLRWAVTVFVLGLGWQLPEWILGRLAARRRLRLEHGMPDAIDLLVICTEAGLSLPQAFEEIAGVLQHSEPEISAEFDMTAAEFKVLSERTAALDNLVKRTGIGSLRSLATTLNQSLRFGTSLTDSLRVVSSDMRAARMARIEEGSARLPVLLSIPLMLFLMPALLIVILSPVVLRVLDLVSHTGLR
jgi:tight adherence protein C